MISDHGHSAGLPETFRKYFWDAAFEELSFESYPRLIAERILNYGNLDDLRWLLNRTDPHFIASLIETSRHINAKTRNYWQTILR